MGMYKANPLGNLKAELILDKSNISGFSSPSAYDDLIRDQVPVKDGLAGQDTFKADASKPSSRAEVEKRRMYLDGGADLKGASMNKEFGSGDTQSGDFSDDKSA